MSSIANGSLLVTSPPACRWLQLLLQTFFALFFGKSEPRDFPTTEATDLNPRDVQSRDEQSGKGIAALWCCVLVDVLLW